jgi:hypothetical protein
MWNTENAVAGSLTVLFLLPFLCALRVLRGALFRLSNSAGHPVNSVHPVENEICPVENGYPGTHLRSFTSQDSVQDDKS